VNTLIELMDDRQRAAIIDPILRSCPGMDWMSGRNCRSLGRCMRGNACFAIEDALRKAGFTAATEDQLRAYYDAMFDDLDNQNPAIVRWVANYSEIPFPFEPNSQLRIARTSDGQFAAVLFKAGTRDLVWQSLIAKDAPPMPRP